MARHRRAPATPRPERGRLAIQDVYYRVAAALSAPDLDGALEQTLRLVAQELRLDAAWVWLLDETGERFYLAASYDLPPYLREPLHMTGEPCWCMQAFFDGEFVSKNVDVLSCSRLQEGIDELGPGATRGLRSHASIALRFGDRALGLLNAVRAFEPRLTTGELDMLATIGAQLGVAVERSRLAEAAAANARAEERAELARELHDTLVQDLTAITLQLESGERRAERDAQGARDRIATAIEIARGALSTLRRNVDDLRGDALRGEPLSVAVLRLARSFTSETGIQVAVEGFGNDLDLPGGLEFVMYRIVAEALTNVRRHADARRVTVVAERRNGTVYLRISDDGRGFDLAKPRSGFGLIAMRERAESFGGILRVESSPGAGTVVEALFEIAP